MLFLGFQGFNNLYLGFMYGTIEGLKKRKMFFASQQ